MERNALRRWRLTLAEKGLKKILTMPQDAHFRVDSRLAGLLGESYRSTELALRELVDNAWDADASHVWINLPQVMSLSPITIHDDGSGMTEQEVRQEYLNIANDRSSRKGELTRLGNRPVKGRKGIGKFAGLMVANRMSLETVARKRKTRIEILKSALTAAHDLEQIDLPIDSKADVASTNGTLVSLSDLNPSLSFPNPEKLRQLLILEYGRSENFQIFVNGEPLKIEDLPGETFEITEEIAGVGLVKLHFTVSDGSKPLKQSGLVLRVQGKLVGKPQYFGLEHDEIIPGKLLRKVYGEVQADGLADAVTADWGAVIESSIAYETLEPFVQKHLRENIRKVHAKEIKQVEVRLKPEVDRRLEMLPEHRREFARQAVSRVIFRLYGENQERVAVVVAVVLDAMEKDEYFQVVQGLNDARDKDVKTLADALESFGLMDMAVVGKQAQSRLRLLDSLDELVSKPATLEKDVHSALDQNLWVLGSEYALVSSNKTLARVIENYANQKFSGPKARNRPDLLLASRMNGRFLLIEFKKPSIPITRSHENQAIEYRDDLTPKFGPIDILILGKGREQSVLVEYDRPDLKVLSFQAIISTARSQLDWLLNELAVAT